MGVIEQLWQENYDLNTQLGNFHKFNVRSIKTLVLSNSLFNKPVILVVAGPSLDTNIHILKENQEKFIILCADVVLYRLLEENIQPDFVCSIDPNPSITRFWSGLDTSNLKLIAPTTTSPEVFALWEGDIFLFNQHDTSSKEKADLLKHLTAPTSSYGYVANMFFVGATLLQVSTIFKPDNIYLLGYDFSFTNNKAYCSGFLEKKLVDLNNVGMDVLLERETKGDTEVHGITTTKLLCLYKDTFTKLCTQLMNNTKSNVVNCTEGGILVELPQDTLENVSSLHIEKITKKQLGKPKKRKRKK